jgi:NADH-ubiquinone oxidoreductase chain 4
LWGYQPERIQAGIYLIIYTISASLPILILFIATYSTSSSLLISSSLIIIFPPSINSNFFWLILVLGFLVKLPIFSTHLWLPKAHVEAPIAGSIILAAILLKLGGYGLIRIIRIYQINLVPVYILLSLSLYGAIITRLICLRQPDIKSLIAYSSVGHIGIILAGIMSYSTWGITAALIIIIAHGLCSSALFIIANLSYSITHTRRIYLTKGMLAICPSLSMWWFLLLSANMAAPPSLNLLSEIILISSIISISTYTIAVLAALRFFTAVYSLHLFAVTQHGQTHFILNPSPSYKSRDILLLIIHLIPLIALIIKSDVILCWS